MPRFNGIKFLGGTMQHIEKPARSKFTAVIDKEVHARLKLEAKKRGMLMQGLLNKIVIDFLDRSQKTNRIKGGK